MPYSPTSLRTNLNNINSDKFSIREVDFHGEKLYLVNPFHNGISWEPHELIYRSSVWNADGYLVSAGFKKFFNYNEREDLVASPDTLRDTVAVEKVDGSLLIVSVYNGHIMVRTRGTIDATHMENGYELAGLFNKYGQVLDFVKKMAMYGGDTMTTGGESLLFEWVTPNNQIVLKYPEPDLYLVGRIFHSNYSYAYQATLNFLAKSVFGVKRPKTWNFGNKIDLLNTVKSWVDQEGICLYFNDGQDIKKIKSEDYLMKHALKAELTLDRVLDLFVSWNCPNYADFVAKFEATYDYEILKMAQGFISQVADAYKEFVKIYQHMAHFVNTARQLPSRKEQAQAIIGAYGKGTIKQGMAFILLDGREIPNDMIYKLLYQLLER